jgi:mRNA interferase HigB
VWGSLRIFNRSTLQSFWEKHPDAEQPLRAWHHEVEKASWQTPQEIREQYGSADFVANNRVIFDICGNNYRLIVVVKYGPLYCVYIRFIGTHAEYDHVDAATI